MKTVYHLRKNETLIRQAQHASLYRDDVGLEITHGLFGSDEWWQKIRSGELSVVTLRGVITNVYMSGHNDWPEFEMATPDGQRYQWTREVDERPFDPLFQQGFEVEVDYVVQRLKQDFGFGFDSKCVLEIRIGNKVSGFVANGDQQ